jgi:xylan 1,4-beta-xylosidase
MINRREFLTAAGASLAGLPALADADTGNPVEVNLDRAAGPFPHYWEDTVGSDRTAVAFREQWQQDLARVHRLTGARSVRCHGLFNDEMGVCGGIGPHGLQLSFLYVSQIYDKLLELGVRPFVELSFMPTPLATSGNSIFFYKGNVSPPKKMEYWGQLVQAFTEHCVKRYGIQEVSQWRFECWNEPNIAFWAGTRDEYFELYRQTALAVKSISSRIPVGGPATAQVAWIPEFISYCVKSDVSLDFLSTHIYANDPQEDIFGKPNAHRYEDVIPCALALARDRIASSKLPKLPLLITEWSSQSPAFIAQTIRDCEGMAESMSYWTFSNVFEEFGPATQFFNSTFGMIGHRGVDRPSLHAFTLLHRIGDVKLESSRGPVLATRRTDESCAILAWNNVQHEDVMSSAPARDELSTARREMECGKLLPLRLRFRRQREVRAARVTMIDMLRGSALLTWESMGCPPYPTIEQIAGLRESAALPASQERPVIGNELALELQPTGSALIELEK